MKADFVQLNMLISTGLFIYSAQLKKDNPVIQLYATDFNEETMLYLDKQEKKLVGNEYNVSFPEKDATLVIDTITRKITEAATKKAEAIKAMKEAKKASQKKEADAKADGKAE